MIDLQGPTADPAKSDELRPVMYPTVRVSDIRQWYYCPRVIWWSQVCPVGRTMSVKMRQGMQKEARLQSLQRRRTLHAFRLTAGHAEPNVELYSSRLGLSGRLDLLLKLPAGPIPVEIKFTGAPVQFNHKLQLAGYGLLLEDKLSCTVPYGFVVRLPANSVERIDLDADLRHQTMASIAAIRSMMATQQIPPPNALPSKCTDCEFRLFCGDVP